MLYELMLERIPFAQELEFLLRIVAACACGAAIGVERTRRLKEAGIRTHLLVACTAAVLMIISKYGFADLTGDDGSLYYGTRGADAARIAAQVVSGISFLGAGVIFKNGNTIKGLTTAAGMWATSSIGMAFGAGMYLIGVMTTLLVLLIQIVMHKIPVGNDAYQTSKIAMTVSEEVNFRESIREQLAKWHAQVVELKVSQNADHTLTYDLTIKTTRAVTYDEMLEFTHAHHCEMSFVQTDNI